MANTKISALTNGNPATSADIIPVDRGGANFGITAGSIALLAPEKMQTGGGYAGSVVMPPTSLFSQVGTDVYTGTSLGGTAVWGYQFDHPGILGVNKATIRQFAAAGTNTLYIGIYSIDRSTLLQEFKFPMTTTGNLQITLASTFNLPAGSYWYVWGVDVASASDQIIGWANANATLTQWRGGVARFGYLVGGISAGHLVAPLPAGAWNADNGEPIPIMLLEP